MLNDANKRMDKVICLLHLKIHSSILRILAPTSFWSTFSFYYFHLSVSSDLLSATLKM